MPVFLISTFLTFALGALAQTSPAAVQLGDYATPDAVERLNREFGLDDPFLVRYVNWLGDVVTGNLGASWSNGLDVTSSIVTRVGVDLSLTLFAVAIALVAGLVAGLAAGLNPGSWIDHAVTAAASFIVAIPEFVIGVFLIVGFAVYGGILPATGYVSPSVSLVGWAEHLILPSLALAMFPAANVARQLRTSLVAVMRENFVVGASARGFTRRRIVLRHALRNAAGPAVASLGLDIPRLLGGAVVIEIVFALPGLGQYALQAATVQDVPAIQGVLVFFVVVVLIVNFAVNAFVTWLRPDVRT